MRGGYLSERERQARKYGLALAQDHYDEFPECPHCGDGLFSAKRNPKTFIFEWKWNCGYRVSFNHSLGLDQCCPTAQRRGMEAIKHFHNQLVREHMDEKVSVMEGGRDG